MNRSLLAQAYAEIQPYTRFSQEDAARLHRGLRLAEQQVVRPYVTTLTACSCPDRFYRGVVCKHMRALQLRRRVAELETQALRIQGHAPEILEALQEVTRYFAVACVLAGTADRHPALQKARAVLDKLHIPDDLWD